MAACSASKEPDSPVPGVKRSESELKAYINFQHDWKALALRQRAEREAAKSNGMAQDSILVALANRQDEEMGRFVKGAPTGPTATALRTTLAGIGSMTGDSRGMKYTPRHDEAALGRARAYYGDGFVRWVLQHESEINATIGPDK
jgi:hypothetical protein